VARSCAGVGSYLPGAAASRWNVYVAFALYLLTPLFFIAPPERAKRGEAIVKEAE
jgi:hypothetical protein